MAAAIAEILPYAAGIADPDPDHGRHPDALFRASGRQRGRISCGLDLRRGPRHRRHHARCRRFGRGRRRHGQQHRRSHQDGAWRGAVLPRVEAVAGTTGGWSGARIARLDAHDRVDHSAARVRAGARALGAESQERGAYRRRRRDDRAGGTQPLAELATALLFVLASSITIAAPVCYYLLGGASARRTLDAAKGWLHRNNAVVMTLLFLVLGAWMLAQGAARLFAAQDARVQPPAGSERPSRLSRAR